MTENFGDNRSQRSSFSKLAKHRQAIVSIEYVLDTEMPNIFTVEVLMEFGTIINAAIDAIRNSNDELGENKDYILEGLRRARQYIQLAIDEFEIVRSKKARYQYIASAGKELREALSYWQTY